MNPEIYDKLLTLRSAFIIMETENGSEVFIDQAIAYKPITKFKIWITQMRT